MESKMKRYYISRRVIRFQMKKIVRLALKNDAISKRSFIRDLATLCKPNLENQYRFVTGKSLILQRI